MRGLLSLNDLKVRTSLILVLLFFMLALIGGAALGILSLRQNNAALQQIVQHQQAATALNTALERYKESQTLLGRALASYVQNVSNHDYTTQSSWVEEGAGVTRSLDGSTNYLLVQARSLLSESQDSFARYETLGAQTEELESGYKRITSQYHRLMENGMAPLLESLQEGRVADFNSILQSRTRSLEEDLYIEVAQQNSQQQGIITQHAERQEKQYALVMQLVSVAMAVALLISVLCYLFLNRVVLSPLRRMDHHFAQIAQGNLTDSINTTSTNEIGVLFAGLSHMQKELQRMVHSVRQGVEQIRYNADDIYNGTIDLSSRSEQQAAALQETAASMEQLASTVRQNTANAAQANLVAQKSSQVAKQGGEAVSSVVHTMQGISGSADKISEIVNVIDSIAFQTNILALNAAVEAARAGEQGRGFAVVAGEVRSLAQRSAQAANEIKELITHSLEQVQKGSQQVNQAGAVVGEVVDAVAGVTTLMSEISEASNEQSQGIEQVNRAVLEMDTTVQKNAHLVQHAASSAESLLQQAEQLSDVVAIFKINDDRVIDIPIDNEVYQEQYTALGTALDEPTYLMER